MLFYVEFVHSKQKGNTTVNNITTTSPQHFCIGTLFRGN